MHNLFHKQHEAISPDGYLTSLHMVSPHMYKGELEILNIPEYFLGFRLPQDCLHLNLKSSLAQLGVDAKMHEIFLDKKERRAQLSLSLYSCDPIATNMLALLSPGSYIAKIFAADDRRLIRSPAYLEKMLKHTNHEGSPLLCFGKHQEHLISLDIIDDRLVVSLPTFPGIVQYDPHIHGLLPLISKALKEPNLSIRKFLSLYQQQTPHEKRVQPHRILLIKTAPLHIQTTFARVVDTQLPHGIQHTLANILEPTTRESGDIYEFHGTSLETIERIPLEFFTIEPYKEHSFFCYRDFLQSALKSEQHVFDVFKTAPGSKEKTATFISKGSELLHLTCDSWLLGTERSLPTPENRLLPQEYLESQPCFPFLNAMERKCITSQGVLFSRYFPSSFLKNILLSPHVLSLLKYIYFQIPSYTHGQFFSQRDRALLMDLHCSGIHVCWADPISKRVLHYAKRTGHDTGMFVPQDRVAEFRSAYFIGVHGSALTHDDHKQELTELLKGIYHLTHSHTTQKFPTQRPLAIMTGGGSGAMAIGNKIAEELHILSCANMVDFEHRSSQDNPYVQAKMTYRLPELIQRQEHFHVDLAIFMKGGIGTDFEFALEQMSLKTGMKAPVPIFLIGPAEYWEEKITPIYQSNKASGTIAGAEWISNCIFCLSSPQAGIEIFHSYMQNTLPIGPEYPDNPNGFTVV